MQDSRQIIFGDAGCDRDDGYGDFMSGKGHDDEYYVLQPGLSLHI